ncbi:MAG: M67 family metallopeptidase [Candidatus Omnitrophota bacterium]
MSLKITQAICNQLVALAKQSSPIEAGGYLAAKEGMVVAVYALTNVERSEEHFSFDPKEQFAALRESRAKGLELCAVFHSHPTSPARPSAEDIALAYDPNMLYVIVSLAEGREDIKAFRIKNQKVFPEPLELVKDG